MYVCMLQGFLVARPTYIHPNIFKELSSENQLASLIELCLYTIHLLYICTYHLRWFALSSFAVCSTCCVKAACLSCRAALLPINTLSLEDAVDIARGIRQLCGKYHASKSGFMHTFYPPSLTWLALILPASCSSTLPTALGVSSKVGNTWPS